ncbi:MAG: hypothetical protein ABI321_01175 [Polyangia bacterium]
MTTLRAFLCTFTFFAIMSLAHAAPDSEGFVPVQPGEVLAASESIPARNLVAAAYGFIFAALAVWTLTVQVRSRRLEAELESLRAKLPR